ncbi:hypothetical protein FY152_04340 [Agrobacterium tumefaciens]|nr:hypothetical protein FY152_04340 [Agrobacterium tumefaciens]
MRDFTKVSPKIWRNKAFKALPTDEARLLMLYLMTCEHQNITGCFRLPEGYAVDDLGWQGEQYRSALAALKNSGLVIGDPETFEVFVCGWFDTNPPTNRKHALGIERVIAAIESDALRASTQLEFEVSRDFADKQETDKAASNVLGMPDRLASTRYLNGGFR